MYPLAPHSGAALKAAIALRMDSVAFVKRSKGTAAYVGCD
jgi:hypothetical protein